MLNNFKVYQEAISIPEKIINFLEHDNNNYKSISKHLLSKNINNVITVARGSSGNVALYSSYLITKYTGLPVSSLPPSLITIEKSAINFSKSLIIIISQSGMSHDLIECSKKFKSLGAKTIFISNNQKSPIVNNCDYFLFLNAGKEVGIAATKTFILSLIVILKITSPINQEIINKDLFNISYKLLQKDNIKWPVKYTKNANDRGFIISRGVGLAIANEISLKFMELSQEYIIPYSAAEVLHGPQSLIDKKTKIFSIIMRDKSSRSISKDLVKISPLSKFNYQFSTLSKSNNNYYSNISPHMDLDPIVIMAKFYPWIIEYTKLKGLNPDKPRYLSKITKTL